MKQNSLRSIALCLLTILWFAAVCRASASHGDPEPWKTEQKRRENVFLCGAADLFVEWSVTFGALHKRAMKVNATATKILQNKGFYQNDSGVENLANNAIQMVKDVINNTRRALVVNRGFMDGIERDFFNAFEAIKDKPDNFTFGHSNWERNGKRESEILEFFKNVTKLFIECKNKTGDNVTIDSLEKKTMAEVDNEITNLTSWEKKRKTEWNAALVNVTNWLVLMQNYTENTNSNTGPRMKNIWKHNATVWDTIKDDCYRVVDDDERGPNTHLVNSSRQNILRHMSDIANRSTVNNSLEENGCIKAYELFQGTLTSNSGEVEMNKTKLKEMCKELNVTLKNHTCTTSRTSVEWLRYRFNITVPEMIERLSKSLVQLMGAEKLVVGTFVDLFVSRRQVLCNEMRVMNKMNTTFVMMVESDASFEEAVKSSNASLVSADHNIAQARNKSDAALKLASMAQNITNAVSTEFNKTKGTSDVVKAYERAMKESKEAVRQVISKTETSREELKKVRGELDAARNKKRRHLEAISKNFSSALASATHSKISDNVCGEGGFVVPNVSIYVSEAVFDQLVVVNFSADPIYDDKLLENCTQKVETLKGLVKEIGVHSNATRDNASQAWKQAIVAEEKAKEAERMGRDVLKNELERQQTELCDMVKQLTEISGTMEMLQKEANTVRESVVAQLKRASTANQRAEDAVIRAVAAEPHAVEATAQYQLTGEAVRSTRIEAKHLVKNAAASLLANKEHIRRINAKFTSAMKAVTSHNCTTETDVCKSAVVCNVTSDLEESLHRIQSLTALMNITVEKEALTRLSRSEKSVKQLMQETSRRANAAEAAAAAALKAAEGSECTPLYLQLLHVVDNFS
ncbi:hypothetical protein, conserved in T. vivax [Trypanosoma vivax Y486]|uniref:Uncharacterized protein n=1 Tax=Trypanosoma vivax (strain Y486) TaxID=1055687 RepID=F9WTY9_TRYVY|nr:hypothetical protein, conserved in T. vivax [Trypanosoma vivax Y486]|eukprot:CCD21035.1 hypothetical protein, conserved in T. vivax [Trypanosoma vivax Y486]